MSNARRVSTSFEIYFDLGFTRAAKPQPETFSPANDANKRQYRAKGAAVYNCRDLEAFGLSCLISVIRGQIFDGLHANANLAL
jgi:hypothetical protein